MSKKSFIKKKYLIPAILGLISAIILLIITQITNTSLFNKTNVNFDLALRPLSFADELYFSEEQDIHIEVARGIERIAESNIYNDGCIVLANVTNKSNHAIRITEFVLYAKNIEVNDEPVIYAYLIGDQSSKIELIICNNGWGSANNLNFEIYDENNTRYNSAIEKTINVSQLISGEKLSIELININDIDTSGIEEYSSIGLSIKSRYSFDETNIEFNEYLGDVHIQRDMVWLELNGDGGYTDKYGLIIDTGNNEVSKEFSCNLEIGAGETEIIPICIAPVKSSSMEIEMEFEINFGKRTVTKFKNSKIEFIVPFYENSDKVLDGDTFDDGPQNILFFPYTRIYNILMTDDESIK